MTLETIEQITGPNPTATIIVMHGLGADGNDFAPICEMLDLRAVGPVRYVLPHAPVRPVTLNGGYPMRAWYDIIPDGAGRREDEAGLREALTEVEALIAKERTRGVSDDRIVLAGFSQGCAMTLMVGLRHPKRLAGLAGMSGYLPLAATTSAERTMINSDVPIFLAHGQRDPMITMDRATASRDALLALSYPVEWHEYPIEHTVSMEEVADLNRWLLRVLKP